jgi:CheY-like chemotaxis protein
MNKSDQRLILVVDDEPAIREMERRILEKGGYRVIEATGAGQALGLLQDGTPVDLLIADLDMPELSGEEMVLRIHARWPNLKVLYVTANIDRLLNVRSLMWDGEAFLDKPFTSQALIEAVALLLTGSLSGAPQGGTKP